MNARSWFAIATFLAAAVFVIPAVSCRSTEDPRETQPLPETETFGDGSFDEIPRFPQSEPLSEPLEEGDVTTQTFKTVRAPKELMAWYERELAREGWDSSAGTRRVGRTGYRGTWVKDDLQVVVAATYGPEADTPSRRERATQYSLVLSPLGTM